jgi:hypothetical protein
MKTCLILLIALGVSVAHSLQAQQPPQIVIPKDYATTFAIAINGKTVPRDKVLDELMMLAKRQGDDASIVAIFPESLRFADWNNVREILWKVGFAKIRYFIRWSSTGKMIELQQVGDATDMIGGPTPVPSP